MTISEYSEENQKIFATLSIQGKSHLIGSASLKGILYRSDYDLAEEAEFKDTHDVLNHILKKFQQKFKLIHANPDWYVTDFKCGKLSDSEPLRWDKKDIANGYKTIKGKRIPFVDCILEKTTMKLDMICKVDGAFSEYTENYYITIGDKSNFNPDDMSDKKIATAILQDGKKYLSEGNPIKALKREYSYLLIVDKDKPLQDKLFDVFNSPLGLAYKSRSDLETIKLVMEQTFKPVSLQDVKHNLQIIKQTLANIVGVDGIEKLPEQLDMVCKLQNKKDILKRVDALSSDLLRGVKISALKLPKSLFKLYPKK
jgi:hypothetical protein